MMKEFNLNIVGKRKIFFAISLILFAVAIVFSIIFTVKIDIRFQGGTMMTYSFDGEIAANDVVSLVKSTLNKEATVQESSDILTEKKNIVISLTEKTGLTIEQQQKLTAAMEEKYASQNIELIDNVNVEPTIGKEFLAKCLVAVGFSALLMIVYIAFRFKRISGWSAGVMAVIALLHDVMMVYAAFVIFRIPIDYNFMAVVLTILGYSVNDTIVIYDRVRENKKLYGKTLSVAELMNKSLNQSLRRTIHTSATTIIAMVVVLIVALIVNIDSLVTFAFPIIIGMISGVYSSLCISSSLWVMWQQHKEKKASKGKASPAKA